MRNVLAHVANSEVGEVAEDLKAIFKVRKHRTARALCEEFVEAYRGRFPKVISVFEADIENALSYLNIRLSPHKDMLYEPAGAAVSGAQAQDAGGGGITE